MPGVSVIITAGSHAASLPRAIESVRAQAYRDFDRGPRACHVKHFRRLDGAVLDVLLPLYRLARWSGRPADGRGPVPGRDG